MIQRLFGKTCSVLSITGITLTMLLTFSARLRAEGVEKKAWGMIVPVFELKNASIEDSIESLKIRSRDLDPTHVGLNFVWRGAPSTETRLNLRLINVPLREAARYVALLSGARLVAGSHALEFVPSSTEIPPAEARVSRAERTAAKLILPQVEFGEATLPEALDFMTDRSRTLDPAKQGVNIVLNVPPAQRDSRITLSLRNLPLNEALRYCAEIAHLVVVVEAYALVVTTPYQQPAPPPEPAQPKVLGLTELTPQPESRLVTGTLDRPTSSTSGRKSAP